MTFTDGQPDNESVPSPDSPKLSAAGSESPPNLLENMEAYDFNVRHTCKGRKTTSWPPLSRKVARNHEAGKKCPESCAYPVDCPLAEQLFDEAAERKKNFEGESLNTTWLNHIFIEELFLNTDYPEFKYNVDKALERGLISSPSVASHITTIFGQQEGYQLGRVLEYQTVTSSTAFRWLLIAYGSHSTRKFFVDSCMDVVKVVDGLVKAGPGRSVYMQDDQLRAQQSEAEEWLRRLKKCAGVLNYWLRVAEEQLKFDQRWGTAKKWVLHGDGWGHLEQIWRTGAIEELTMDLWDAKSNITLKLIEAGQNPDCDLQYVNLLRDAGVADGGELERLIFWPQTGKLEWAYPTQESAISKVAAEQIRMSADLFLNGISRQCQVAAVPDIAPHVEQSSLRVERDTLGQHPAPRILINGISDQQEVTSQGLTDCDTSTGSEITSHTRVGNTLAEHDTAQQGLPDLSSNDRIYEDIAPRVKTNMFATDWEDTTLVRPGKSTTWYWGREPRPIGHGSVPRELEESRFWYSARKSSDTPYAIEASVTAPISSPPRAKAEDENESTSRVRRLDRDSNILLGIKDETIKEEDIEDSKSGYITSNNRPYTHIDLADLGKRLAVLDAAELGAAEESKQQQNRSLAEQALLDLPRRETQLREELQHSARIKKTLLDKLDSDTPIGSKMDAVGIFLDAIEEETEKMQGWTEDLREAEAEIDRGYDGDWEEGSQSEETHNNTQAILETSVGYSSSSKGKEHTQTVEESSVILLGEGESIENEKQKTKTGVHGETEETDAGEVVDPAIAQAVGRLPLGDWNDGSVTGSDTRGYDGVGPSSSVKGKTTKADYTAEEHNIFSPSTGN
ncbi:hypothetical protein BOTNAR_0064g00360 [Botryotinia narcissicola]|uniref:Uncharacterized protein n=1 Tax=Botryotinia narcissicola TaxID=278944 RepID=A0A4Z1IXU4_9HELO|nr:hypothetical protein BOTNAR_0064g00360 [Botryotinia narcissicola]